MGLALDVVKHVHKQRAVRFCTYPIQKNDCGTAYFFADRVFSELDETNGTEQSFSGRKTLAAHAGEAALALEIRTKAIIWEALCSVCFVRCFSFRDCSCACQKNACKKKKKKKKKKYSAL